MYLYWLTGTLYPLTHISPFPPLPCPWQPPFYSLPLWACLFKLLHVIEIMQYLSFCVWLISLMTVAPGLSLLSQMTRVSSFLILNNIPLCIYTTFFYLFLCWWTFRLFPHLSCCDLCCNEHWNANSGFDSFGCIPGSGSAGSCSSPIFYFSEELS